MTRKNQRFTALAVRRMRAAMRERLAVPTDRLMEQRDREEVFRRSPVDPTQVVDVLRNLRLKPGLVLCGYLFSGGIGGNGFVYAVPEDTAVPDPEQCHLRDDETRPFLDKPVPPGALADVLDAFDGDGSPRSFLEASILKRELAEFGAWWHGIQWGTHEVLDRDPLAGAHQAEGEGMFSMKYRDQWQWATDRPEDWRPSVRILAAGGAVVEFLTATELHQAAILRHTDRYRPGSYRSASSADRLATGPGGYVF